MMRRGFLTLRRMLISHLLVVFITSLVTAILFAIVGYPAGDEFLQRANQNILRFVASDWQLGVSDGETNNARQFDVLGYTLIVSPKNEILYSQGDTPCRAGQPLAECAPALLDAPVGEYFVQSGDSRVSQIVQTTIFDERLISVRGPATYGQRFNGYLLLMNAPGMIAWALVLIMICALPLALLVARLVAVPQARRIAKIMVMSRALATDDYLIRVNDRRDDDIGDLARQFDDLADVLQQNIAALRDLNTSNQNLMQQAEQTAVQAERLRLSRDLHDSTAQGLFTLSLLTATLPDLLRDDPTAIQEKVAKLVELSNSVRTELQTMLVDLRPPSVIQLGLEGAVEYLCTTWETEHTIPVNCSCAVHDLNIPDTVQDIVYRVVQETLNNVAKHAQAASVSVALLVTRRQVALSINDDGRGFDTTAPNGHFGIAGMRERSAAVGAELLVESEPLRGTTVQWLLGLEA
jgi:signal transduction histidine kinase